MHHSTPVVASAAAAGSKPSKPLSSCLSCLLLRHAATNFYENDVFPLIIPTMPAAFSLLCGYEYRRIPGPEAPRRLQRAIMKTTSSMPAKAMVVVTVGLMGTRLALASVKYEKSSLITWMHLGFSVQLLRSRSLTKGILVSGAVGLGIDLLLTGIGYDPNAESRGVSGSPICPYEDDSIGGDYNYSDQ